VHRGDRVTAGGGVVVLHGGARCGLPGAVSPKPDGPDSTGTRLSGSDSASSPPPVMRTSPPQVERCPPAGRRQTPGSSQPHCPEVTLRRTCVAGLLRVPLGAWDRAGCARSCARRTKRAAENVSSPLRTDSDHFGRSEVAPENGSAPGLRTLKSIIRTSTISPPRTVHSRLTVPHRWPNEVPDSVSHASLSVIDLG
jgi:hypothetical protein